MVRYAWALRGQPKDSTNRIDLKLEEIDLAGGQLTERYLCDINANGEVPVLGLPAPAKPMPESLDITYYFAQRYPDLLPSAHEHEIKHLLSKLHDINFYSLTFTGKPQVPKGAVEKMQGMLKQEGISERYQKALEWKIKR